MVFKKENVKWIMTLFSAIVIIAGLIIRGYDSLIPIMMSMFLLTVAISLLLEIGIKKVTNISTLKKLGIIQYISLAIAGIMIITAVSGLFNLSITFFNQISGYALMFGGVMFGIEAWSNN